MRELVCVCVHVRYPVTMPMNTAHLQKKIIKKCIHCRLYSERERERKRGVNLIVATSQKAQ